MSFWGTSDLSIPCEKPKLIPIDYICEPQEKFKITAWRKVVPYCAALLTFCFPNDSITALFRYSRRLSRHLRWSERFYHHSSIVPNTPICPNFTSVIPTPKLVCSDPPPDTFSLRSLVETWALLVARINDDYESRTLNGASYLAPVSLSHCLFA